MLLKRGGGAECCLRHCTTRRTVSYKASGPDASGMYDASYSVVQGVGARRVGDVRRVGRCRGPTRRKIPISTVVVKSACSDRCKHPLPDPLPPPLSTNTFFESEGPYSTSDHPPSSRTPVYDPPPPLPPQVQTKSQPSSKRKRQPDPLAPPPPPPAQRPHRTKETLRQWSMWDFEKVLRK